MQEAAPDLSLAVSWLEDCRRQHPECSLRDISAHPSRLLRIVTDSSAVLRLVELGAETDVPPYTALSYCWGEVLPLRTTRDNFEQHKAGIQSSALPRTFQDAVAVTKHLGCEHLWIDSLCIIQDSQTDWESECIRMGGIFANAELTIAAGDAANSSVGFLRNYDMGPHFHIPRLQGQPELEENGGIIVEYLPNGRTFPSANRPSKLSSRGWTLQEHMLSNKS